MVNMKFKRSAPAPERLQEIRDASYYEVCCGTDDCVCSHPGTFCERGFFSLFLQAVYGICFARQYGLTPLINYGNIRYAYSDPATGEPNFWRYFFEENDIAGESGILRNQLREVFPLRIWVRIHLREIHREVIKTLRFRQEVQVHLDQQVKAIDNKKVLGIHWRGTDHPSEIPPISEKRILRSIENKMVRYDALFVATDEKNFLNRMQKRFGNKVLESGAFRSDTGKAIHRDPKRPRGIKIGLDALTDCYCLSRCTEVMLVPSNLSYAVLLFNPEIQYTLLAKRKIKLNIIRTSLLYLLDRWGIRKW